MQTQKKMKRLLCLALVFAMVAALALPTFAEEDDPFSKEKLREIVASHVGAAINAAGGLASTEEVRAAVKELVKNTVDAEWILSQATPLIQGAVNAQLKKNGLGSGILDSVIDSAVQSVVNNRLVQQILGSSFVEDVMDRAVDIAVDDILTEHMPAILAAATEDLIDKYTDEIFALPEGEIENNYELDIKIRVIRATATYTSKYYVQGNAQLPLYDMKVTRFELVSGKLVVELTTTGWSSLAVAGYLGLNLDTAGNVFGSMDIDYAEFIMPAIQRALLEVVNERVAGISGQIMASLQSEIKGLLPFSETGNMFFEGIIGSGFASIPGSIPGFTSTAMPEVYKELFQAIPQPIMDLIKPYTDYFTNGAK